MTVPSHASQSRHTEDDMNNEAPLLSEDGRDFLAGKINADKYVGMARDVAAARARRDLYYQMRERRHTRKSVALIGLFLVAISYTALGVVTLVSSPKGLGLTLAAFVTAGLTGLAAFAYRLYRGDGKRPTQGRQFSLTVILVGLIDRTIDHLDWFADHEIRRKS